MTDVIHEFDVVKVEGVPIIQPPIESRPRCRSEVRLEGEPFSVIMRTPGTDCDLVAGFLFSEAVIQSPTIRLPLRCAIHPMLSTSLSPAARHAWFHNSWISGGR